MSEVEAGTAAHTDESTALQNWQFLQRSFSAFFPHLAGNPFFITGESYAGVYIPTLAAKIVDAHKAGQDIFADIDLRGIAVGNGCAGSGTALCGVDPSNTDFKLDFTGHTLQLLYGRGLISSAVHTKILDKCDDPTKGFPTGYSISHGLPSCIGLTKESLCGMQAVGYFTQFLRWLLAAEAGDHSQTIPDCFGDTAAIAQSPSTMAVIDALQLPGDPFGPPGSLPAGQQATQLLQLNAQIWPIIFSQIQEQSPDILAQYSLTQTTLFLIGARGSTPAWKDTDAADPLGRVIVSLFPFSLLSVNVKSIVNT